MASLSVAARKWLAALALVPLISSLIGFAHSFGITRPLIRRNFVRIQLSRIANEYSAENSSPSTKYSFEAMARFDHRLSLLEEEAPEFLNDYFEKDIYSFSINPGEEQQSLSVSSTVYGLQALSEYPSTQLARSVGIPGPKGVNSELMADIDKDENESITDGPLKNQIRALIHSGWRENDLYDISLMLSIILKLDPSFKAVRALLVEENQGVEESKGTGSKFSTMLQKLMSGRPRRRWGEEQLFSAYITYECVKVYVDLANTMNQNPSNGSLRLGVLAVETKGASKSENSDDDGNSSTAPIAIEVEDSEFFFREITIAVARSAEIARDELCRQLAYRSAGDTGNFDVIKLVYNLLTYVKATESLKGNTLLSTKSKPSIHDGGKENSDSSSEAATKMAAQVAVPKINRRLVASALEVFFEEQDDSDGLWDRGQPIYKSFKREGRNVGNAYVYGVEALASTLNVLGSSGPSGSGNAEVFRPYLRNLEQTLDWIERNIDIETTVIAEECNLDTGRCYGRALRGWSSPHLSPSVGPNAWSTAQTLKCLARMRRIVRELMHNDVLEEFGGISISSKNMDRNAAWDRLLDSDLGGGTPDCRTIKSVLEERVVDPFINAVRVDDPGVGAAYSTILFGSPGTAKTTITEAVAEKMGWDFVVIDTTAFLADGLTNVASRIRYVFSRLQALRRCVILFDEIEEFCLDRETPGISMESRMLTTAMLTAINDLRRTKQSVFFLATNRLRAFDAAIIRPGRFDMQLFVGTPNLEARVILFRQALESIDTNENEKQIEKIVATYREFLRSVWTQDAMFMNYLEGKQFASRVASMVETSRRLGGEGVLDEAELARILAQQAAVMTARGSVREEYEAQMGLSRL
mmetsp:Transcript_18098/g.37315  ORF Transcript_18098/g.37315 Transcript_18098/m.37315 type:complete len:868 (+) Transcript_18098:276-2879(+)|eukprot:CAMPEP_0197281676 /NCGR_PEP_ID=MMETSP1432-20130617/23109_1 /TAXON_ID=44447 /ORGANISM="Pseudo-nitzschia delicatissima, Strain UNC1205" /LENGTH=867 /DNA_ID=CAMNT_0042748521 /DNA_START=226 /DNA_END=2829 /DNA_ORIENTATION=+